MLKWLLATLALGVIVPQSWAQTVQATGLIQSSSWTYGTVGSITLQVTRLYTSPWQETDQVSMNQLGVMEEITNVSSTSQNITVTFDVPAQGGSWCFKYHKFGGSATELGIHVTFGTVPAFNMGSIVPSYWDVTSPSWTTLEDALTTSGLPASRVILTLKPNLANAIPANWKDKLLNLTTAGYNVYGYVDTCGQWNNLVAPPKCTEHGSGSRAYADVISDIDTILGELPTLDGILLDNTGHEPHQWNRVNLENISEYITNTKQKNNIHWYGQVSHDRALYNASTITVMEDGEDIDENPHFEGAVPAKAAAILHNTPSSEWTADLAGAYAAGFGWYYATDSTGDDPANWGVPDYAADMFAKIWGHNITNPRAHDDPHLTNTLGETFDIMQPGTHTLLQIPRGAAKKDTLLKVEGITQLLGGHCEDIFIRDVSISGKWTEELGGELSFHAGEDVFDSSKSGATVGVSAFQSIDALVNHLPPRVAQMPLPKRRNVTQRLRLSLGPTVALLDWVHTPKKGTTGVNYLNFGAYHLRRANAEVGGILGHDSHSWAASKPKMCRRSLRGPRNGISVMRQTGLDVDMLDESPDGTWTMEADLDGGSIYGLSGGEL